MSMGGSGPAQPGRHGGVRARLAVADDLTMLAGVVALRVNPLPGVVLLQDLRAVLADNGVQYFSVHAWFYG